MQKIKLGSKVTLEFENGKRGTFVIVSPGEAKRAIPVSAVLSQRKRCKK